MVGRQPNEPAAMSLRGNDAAGSAGHARVRRPDATLRVNFTQARRPRAWLPDVRDLLLADQATCTGCVIACRTELTKAIALTMRSRSLSWVK